MLKSGLFILTLLLAAQCASAYFVIDTNGETHEIKENAMGVFDIVWLVFFIIIIISCSSLFCWEPAQYWSCPPYNRNEDARRLHKQGTTMRPVHVVYQIVDSKADKEKAKEPEKVPLNPQ